MTMTKDEETFGYGCLMALLWVALGAFLIFFVAACGGDGGDGDGDLHNPRVADESADAGEQGIRQDCSGGNATAVGGDGNSANSGNASAEGGDGGNCTVVIGGGNASGGAGDDNSSSDDDVTETGP